MFSTPTPRLLRTDSHGGTCSCTLHPDWFYRTQLSHRWGPARAPRRPAGRAPRSLSRSRSPERCAARSPVGIRCRSPSIPFGVDTERFQPAQPERAHLLRASGSVVLPFKAVGVGRAGAPRHRLNTSCNSTLAHMLPCGCWDSVEPLLGEVSEDESCCLTPQSDLLVHPSALFGTLSATVLQGLSAGLPVLGGSAVEGVVESGQTGWVVPDADAESFRRPREPTPRPSSRRCRCRLGDGSARAAISSWPRNRHGGLSVGRRRSIRVPTAWNSE